MESYKKRKLLEEKYGKLINIEPFNDSDLKGNQMKSMLNKLLILLTKKG